MARRGRTLYPTTHQFQAAGSSTDQTTSLSYISPLVKWLMFGFNFFFWVVGCVLIAIGLWAHAVSEESRESRIDSIFDFLLTPSVLVISLGAAVFVLAFCGCLGALRENTCLLATFIWALVLIFLAECVVAILAFSFSSLIKPKLQPILSKELVTRYHDDRDLQNFVDFIQEEFQCCGLSEQGYKDWQQNMYFNCTKENQSSQRCGVPFSCCKEPRELDSGLVNQACGIGAQEEVYPSDRIWVEGCLDAASRSLRTNMHIVAGVLIGTAIPQLIGIYLARTLHTQIKDQRALWQQ